MRQTKGTKKPNEEIYEAEQLYVASSLSYTNERNYVRYVIALLRLCTALSVNVNLFLLWKHTLYTEFHCQRNFLFSSQF